MGKRSNEYQRLVARLYEQIAAPSRVTESALLAETATGTLREVDILIEGDVDGQQIMLAIECRDRKRKDTIEWIDGLIGKYSDLPVDKIVAVSSQGFTKTAVMKAASKGIVLIETEKAEKVDWAKQLSSGWRAVALSNSLLYIGAKDERGVLVVDIKIDPETFEPISVGAVGLELFGDLQQAFFHYHAGVINADIEARLLKTDRTKWDKPRWGIWEFDADLQAKMSLGTVKITKLAFGVGTYFHFADLESKNVVLGEHAIAEFSNPDLPTTRLVLNEAGKVISLDLEDPSGRFRFEAL